MTLDWRRKDSATGKGSWSASQQCHALRNLRQDQRLKPPICGAKILYDQNGGNHGTVRKNEVDLPDIQVRAQPEPIFWRL